MNIFTLLIIMLVLGALALAGWGLGQYGARKQRLDRKEKAELNRLRKFYYDVDSIYMENRDVDLTAIQLGQSIKDFRGQQELWDK